jgi:hypothetical protein
MDFISKTYRTSYTRVAYNMQNVIGQSKQDGDSASAHHGEVNLEVPRSSNRI